MAYQVKNIRALVVPAIGQNKFVHATVHRYGDAGGHDIPLTSALFTVDGRHYEDTGFARDLTVKAVWRGYTVYIVHPAQANGWAGEAVVLKHSSRGRSYVNMRTQDRLCALKVVRRLMRASDLAIPQSARA